MSKLVLKSTFNTDIESSEEMCKSVNLAVDWSVDFLRALLSFEKKQPESVLYYDILEKIEKSLNDNIFASKLKNVLLSEIANKVKENKGMAGMAKYVRNALSDIRHNNEVNLKQAINKALVELDLPSLGCPPLPDYFLLSTSKVSPEIFIGHASPFIDFEKHTYEFKQPKNILPSFSWQNNSKNRI